MNTIFRGELRSRRGRALAWLDSLFVDHAVLRTVWTNFAAVVPGKLYRANHPTPGRLAALTRRHGLKTIVNLRGRNKGGSDALSREMAARLGLDLIDAPLKSRRAPEKPSMLYLIDALRRMREPALIHCKSGADRAGLAAAIYLLLHGARVAEARKQLSFRHGHIARAETGALGAFLLAYENQAEGRIPFADWVRDEYDPDSLDRAYRAGGVARFVTDRVLRRE